MASFPDYNHVQESLLKADATMQAPEAHGALCGILCAMGTVEIDKWLSHVYGEQESGNALLQELSDELIKLTTITTEQINSEVTDFQLWLPDDSEQLAIRVQALASWCQGFVYGLAAGGMKQDSKLPEDTAELIADLIEIARVHYDELEEIDEEEGESEFMELEEYVRVGVLLINEELQPLKQTPPTSNNQLH